MHFCRHFLPLCVFRIFWCGPFLKFLLNLLQYCFCFMFQFFDHKACVNLAPRPGIEPALPALEGKILTTGWLPGKSQPLSWYMMCLVSPEFDATETQKLEIICFVLFSEIPFLFEMESTWGNLTCMTEWENGYIVTRGFMNKITWINPSEYHPTTGNIKSWAECSVSGKSDRGNMCKACPCEVHSPLEFELSENSMFLFSHH